MSFSTGWGGHRILLIGVLLSISWALLSPLIIYFVSQPNIEPRPPTGLQYPKNPADLQPSLMTVLTSADFERLNHKLYDPKPRLFARSGLNSEIVHLDIDDETIKKYGQWPWDRALSARIVNRLTELGVKVIVFDIMYASRGRSREGDEALAKAVAESGRVIMATGLFSVERGSLPEPATLMKTAALREKAWPISPPPEFQLPYVEDPRDSTIPLLAITEGARELGHINDTPDEDGIHRRIGLFIRLKDRLVPSLGLAALVAYLNADPTKIVFGKNQIEIHHPGGTIKIPVDFEGRMLVNWPRDVWGSFDNYPAWYVLEGKQDAEMIEAFKDKIVIVSIAWTGNTDMGATPVEKQILLSRIHSSALDTMLTGRFIYEVGAFPIPVLVSVLIFLGPLALALRLRFYHAVILYLGLYGIYALLVVFAFGWKSLDIPMAESSFVFLPAAAGFLISRAASTEKDRRQIRETFGRYLSDDVVTEILKSPGGINLTGEVRDITVLVSDLRGSTPMGEALEPPVVLTVINRYLDKMVKIIMKHGGTIDEFTGDGILVFFGAPRVMADAAKRAVLCALDMQKAMPELNRENFALGLPELRMGIGINSGRLVVGNIGSEKRKKYGAIGSAINIAFRVEAQTDRNGGEILITESVRDGIDGHLELGPARTVRLKGIEKPMDLYPVIEMPDVV
jgi:adenylate cyclase